jgi:hypothetical protein
MHMGFTTQFEEAECFGPGVVVVASSSAGGSWPDARWEALMPVKTVPDPGHGGC